VDVSTAAMRHRCAATRRVAATRSDAELGGTVVFVMAREATAG
jgi:hypothetical protein